MFDLLATAFIGAGMFVAGWFAHAFFTRPAEAPGPTRWACPKCGRERVLPPELDGKVLVCNNCQVRLARDGS